MYNKHPITRRCQTNIKSSVREGMVYVSMSLDNPFIECRSDEDNHSPIREHHPDVSQTWQPAQGPRSLATAAEEQSDHMQSSPVKTVKIVGGKLIAPVRFFVDKNRRICRIRFDQAFPGRFIHLMMWSAPSEPGNGTNVDIEAVLADGLVGPRYNPPVEIQDAASHEDKTTAQKPCDF